ncbi:hypothetical protein FOQG_04849 [Fusarium oxysporum f. sp. raphani 54005]|uniref:Uncharacterized protein n=5 Tax=Fusarium oxysporum TaxID=5507 RepID=X0CQH6_FUSOX|nr:hypothetical protein FOXG_20454 [Fusarium oxysporum f. sp. lycopersici 4287]EXA54445.1 hypothetical protein FOVG_01902 [Fusarium oxysporum f. sp. pisi HDV247]EXK46675.1 hypothetical protein FOMG_00349 [Fusarium oxysporum f. sp. melonis 26406]EXK93593.1 hypothetical protein FOQG_04849 [Fusarium oxysporum f. sp. raphani 54005]EXM29055.1 hypothetical protein FOTG_05292 [Fusarium oxysporum f. sp. vasinfectum 25433]KNB11059.1 hypothetical protein FOXG_20454 [Fusarium oxysporum f. sp. lycopersici
MFSKKLVYIVHFVPVWSRANSARQSHYITDDQLTRNHLLDSPSQVHHQKHIHIKITIQPQALNPRSLSPPENQLISNAQTVILILIAK